MAYSELIKSFERIRAYMRQFYVYGFKRREEYDQKSARSYDNERRRVESWLGDHMRFRQTAKGKNVFLSVDSRVAGHNPLYKAWKAKSFTDGDITLHFLLFDILYAPDISLPLHEITEEIDRRLSCFDTPCTFDESTLRKKLKEYIQEGLILAEKQGRVTLYRRSESELPSLNGALDYFSEVAPCGVIGSFLLDKTDKTESRFRFKHHYITAALDSEILLQLFSAMHEKRTVTVTSVTKSGRTAKTTLVPLRIYCSARSGRQHLMAFVPGHRRRVNSFRVDQITSVAPGEPRADFDALRADLDRMQAHQWGVSTQSPSGARMETAEFTVQYRDNEQFIHQRLVREKRCGAVQRLSPNSSRFSAEVFDAAEMAPWIRTFIGRITELRFSDPALQKHFTDDLEEMYRMYGLKGGDEA